MTDNIENKNTDVINHIAGMTDDEISKLDLEQLQAAMMQSETMKTPTETEETKQSSETEEVPPIENTEPTQVTEDDTQAIQTEETDPSLEDVAPQADQFMQIVTAPFKANGVEVQVTDPAQIVKFMQMGLNYQKKLGEIRPHLRLIQALESAGLTQEDKINNLIDLAKHDKGAIAQLLKESNYDAYDVDSDVNYIAKNHVVDARTFAFNEAVQNVSETESGKNVISTVSRWDESSKSILFDDPSLLNTLHEHTQNGLFNATMGIMMRDKAAGVIPANVSDIQAYNTIATHLMNNDSRFQVTQTWSTQNQPQSQTSQPVVVGNNLTNPVKRLPTNPNKNMTRSPNDIPAKQEQPFNFVDPRAIANLTDEQIAQYGSWEDFVNKMKLKGNK